MADPLPGDGRPVTVTDRTIDEDPGTAGLPLAPGGGYVVDMTVERRPADDGDELRLRLKGNDDRFVTVGYDFEAGVAFVVREPDAASAALDGAAADTYRAVRTAPATAVDGRVRLTVLVDASSVEVFVNGGERTLTSLVFPDPGAERIEVVTAGGSLHLHTFTYTPLAAPVPR